MSAIDKTILATAYELLDQANETLPLNRRVSKETIREVVRRELPSTPKAHRAAINFLTTVENPHTNTPTVHTDLLHPGHPLSTATSTKDPRREAAQFFSADPKLPEDLRPLIASAIESDPQSAQRQFYQELLFAREVPISTFSVIEEADQSILKKKLVW